MEKDKKKIKKKEESLDEIISSAGESTKRIIKGRIQYLLRGNRKTRSTITRGLHTGTCPACGNEVKVVGKKIEYQDCPYCGVRLYKINKILYTMRAPQERLMIYNWEITNEEFNVNVFDPTVSINTLMQKYYNLSVSYVKNEAWSANKLLEMCNRDLELCVFTINTYYSDIAKYNKKVIPLMRIVAYPRLADVVESARRNLIKHKLAQMDSIESIEMLKERDRYFGQTYSE